MRSSLLKNISAFANATKNCVIRYFELRIGDSSAELSYYLLFSLFPLIMVSSALTLTNIKNESVLLEYLPELLPETIIDLFYDFKSHVLGQNNTAIFSSSVILALSAMTRYINCIKRKLRAIYKTEKEASLLIEWILSVVYSFFVFVGLCFTFVLQSMGSEILKIISEKSFIIPAFLLAFWPILKFVFIGVYAFLLLILLYKTVPMRKQRFRDVIYGAVFSSSAWILVSVIFSYYIDNLSHFSALYGSFSSFIVLMLWLYLMNNIILSGAMVCKVISDQRINKKTLYM